MLLYIKYFFFFSKNVHNFCYSNLWYFFFFFISNNKTIKVFFLYNLNFISESLKTFKIFFFFSKFNFKKTEIFSTINSNFNIYDSSSEEIFKNKFFFAKNKNLFNNTVMKKTFAFSSFTDIYSYISIFENTFLFGSKNLLINFDKKINFFKFNFFILLLNANWHIIINSQGNIETNQLFLEQVITISGFRQYKIFSVSYLWSRWTNLFFLLINIFFFNAQVFIFSKIFFKNIVLKFNFFSWDYSYIFWKYFLYFFFFKFIKITVNVLNFFQDFQNLFYSILFIPDAMYHNKLILLGSEFNIPIISLNTFAFEPWSSFYSIPVNNINPYLQYLFILIFFKLKIFGINYNFFFKKNYIFFLKLLSIVNFFVNSQFYENFLIV